MTNGRMNENAGRGASRDPAADALAALQGMHQASPDDGSQAAEPPADEPASPQQAAAPANSGDSAAGNLSASGFVGMLAKDPSGEDSAEADSSEPANGDVPQARPQPKPMLPGRPTASRRTTAGTDEIREAREIELADTAAPAPRAQPRAAAPRTTTSRRPGSRAKAVPAWYQIAMPLSFTIGGLLTLVSMWAVLASIGILARIRGIPLVTLPEEGAKWEFWDYIPFLMLLCLPVAIALVFMGAIMAKQLKAATRDEAN